MFHVLCIMAIDHPAFMMMIALVLGLDSRWIDVTPREAFAAET